MAKEKAHRTWTVLPHEDIVELADNLWHVTGSLPGMSLKRTMVVVKLQDGSLVLHNPIALEEQAQARLEAWGAPALLVIPNRWHRLDARIFKDRYPAAKVVCPAAAVSRVERVVPVDLTYDDFPEDADVVVRHVDGTRRREGVMIVRHGETATIVFNDLIFNMPHLHGFTGFVLRRLTGSTGGPKVTRIARLFLVDDNPAVAGDLRRLADTPGLSRIIVSHQDVIATDPAGILRRLADGLA